MKNILFVIIYIFIIPIYSFAQDWDTWKDGQVDTIDYNHLLVKDSTNSYENGYIEDSFSIGNTHFRVIHTNRYASIIVEKNINGMWVQSFSNDACQQYSLEDINGDGYNDFICSWKRSNQVYFFNPALNDFMDDIHTDTSDIYRTGSTEDEWTLIDSTNNIFCDMEGKSKELGGDGPYSILYTYKKGSSIGFERIELYMVDVQTSDRDTYIGDTLRYDSVTVLILYKLYKRTDSPPGDIDYEPEKSGERIYPTPYVRYYDFDYVKFWKRRYKKLLGIK